MRRLLFALALASVPAAAVAAPDDDWGVTRDPFNLKDIGAYKGTLARAPHDPTSFARLLELYKRYRTIDLLKGEYAKVLAAKPADWSALVVSARLERATGDEAKALAFYTSAVAAKADDANAWLAIGELDVRATKPADARAAYDKALAHTSTKDLEKKALRALADLALAANDIDAANAYFKQFLDLDPTNAQLWIERGDAMLAANRRDIALESYAAAEKLLGSDPARRVEVVSRRGQALEAMGKEDEAIAEYRRAIKLAPKGYYLEVELTGRIIDIYRKQQKLGALLAAYEKEWPEGARGHFEWNTLGKLYEETGSQDKAIAALKRAVAKSPSELETQRHLITLLENSGRDDEALAQYEAVVRAAPGDARFQIDLADRYARRGEDKKALEVMQRLEQRFPSDAGVLSAIADFYQRIGKEDLAIVEYERLAKLEPDDPSHLVVLGEQYWTKGDKAHALATWKQITRSGKAISFAKLGEVMAEHNDAVSARTAYDEAIKLDPKVADYYKGRAGVLEMLKQPDAAIADLMKLLAIVGTKPTDRLARRDAHRRIVALAVRLPGNGSNGIRKLADAWRSGFAQGDVESGYFLIEVYAKQPMQGEPRATLEKLSKLVPDDQELVLDLVAALRRDHHYDQAVAKLLELAKAVPSREREVYSKISEIKTEARQDDEAIRYAQLALDKAPSDPSAYERLAERYVDMQRFPDAIAAYEKTVKLDAQNSKAHFALAQLYVQTGEPMKAAALLRQVLRTASAEEIVGRAGRQAIDLEEMTQTLGELEKVLSPLSFVMAHKPVYRRVLVDLYLRYVPRLVERERHGNDEVRKAARAELDRVGAHGLRPLLEALRDDKEPQQQRTAVEVLGHLGNKGAAGPLVHLARQEPPKEQRRIGTLTESLEREVRVEALVAAGRLGDPSVLADLMPLLDNGEISVREAATFALGRAGDKRAIAALVKALADHRPSVQVLACLGLGQVDDPRVAPALVAILKDPSHPDTVRAAAAYALGLHRTAAAVPALLLAIDDNRGDTQRIGAWALGQIGDPKALGPLVRAYFARTGASGGGHDDELVWAIGRTSGGIGPSAPAADIGDYPTRNGKYDEHAAIVALPGSLPKPAPAARLVLDHVADIAAGLGDALAQHRDVVVSVLSDLDSGGDAIGLGALTPVPSAAPDPKLAVALAAIGDKIEPVVAAQLTSEDPKVRALALAVVAKLDGAAHHDADVAIVTGLADPADQVRASAMAAVATLAHRRGQAPAPLVAALVKELGAPSWADRRAAALAIGKLGPAAQAGAPVTALVTAARDPSSFVREAVAMALVEIGGPTAAGALASLARDDVPQVREAAARMKSTP